jgi:hypothetical protein
VTATTETALSKLDLTHTCTAVADLLADPIDLTCTIRRSTCTGTYKKSSSVTYTFTCAYLYPTCTCTGKQKLKNVQERTYTCSWIHVRTVVRRPTKCAHKGKG